MSDAWTMEDGESVPAVIIQSGGLLTKHSVASVARALGIPAATLAKLRAGTHVAVPKVPTPRMCMAAENEAGTFGAVAGPRIYAAMLAATEAGDV